MRVVDHVVDTRGAPLDLAIVEQTFDRCKELMDGLKYLQTVLPNIQVVEAEDCSLMLVCGKKERNLVVGLFEFTLYVVHVHMVCMFTC